MEKKIKQYLVQKYFDEWREAEKVDDLMFTVGEIEVLIRRLQIFWGIDADISFKPYDPPQGRSLGKAIKKTLPKQGQ